MKKITTALLLILSVITMGGCYQKMDSNTTNNKGGSSVTTGSTTADKPLTERQKEILSQMGLSTEADKLEPNQRVAIYRIEELLERLEKKYNKKFAYAGYIPAGLLEREQLFAYPMDENRKVHQFTMRNDGNDNFEDNYFEVSLMYSYEEFVKSKLKDIIKDSEYKIFSSVSKTQLKEAPKSMDEYIGSTFGSNKILINSEGKTEEEMKNFAENLKKYLEENKMLGLFDIVFTKGINLNEINRFNYSDLTNRDIAWTTILNIK